MSEIDPLISPAIAELIRAGRLRKGLNQEDLAQRAGVSRTTLHHLERGAVHKPRASTLSRLATVLELSPEELARGWKSAESGSNVDPQSLEFLNEQVVFDSVTNPVVAEIREAEPDHFRGFQRADWEELSSQVGVGGGLTREGVLAAAARIQRDRETLARLRLVLQTHLREPARQLIDALYQSVAILPPESPAPGARNSVSEGATTEERLSENQTFR